MASKAARKSAPSTGLARTVGSSTEDEGRNEKKLKRVCDFCKESCSLSSDDSDGDCKQIRILKSRCVQPLLSFWTGADDGLARSGHSGSLELDSSKA